MGDGWDSPWQSSDTEQEGLAGDTSHEIRQEKSNPEIWRCGRCGKRATNPKKLEHTKCLNPES